MSDVFYLRDMASPVSPQDLAQMAGQAGSCFDLHDVDWHSSFLADDGKRMLCWYRARDTESVRIALRTLGADLAGVWPGQVTGAGRADAANVLLEFETSGEAGDTAVIQRELESTGSLKVVLAIAATSQPVCLMLCHCHDPAGPEPALATLARVPRRLWAGSMQDPAALS